MALYAGLDRADTPNPNKRKLGREIYTVCFVGTETTLEVLRTTLANVRHERGMGSRNEFRGHDCREETQFALLSAVKGLEMRVAATLYEKSPEKATHGQSMGYLEFQEAAALKLFRKFAGRYPVSKLWCDQDMDGRERQRKFETSIQRVHRELYPGHRFEAKHKASHQSDLIQIADIVAYGLSRLERGLVESSDLRRILSALRNNPANIFEGPMEWRLE